MRIMLWFLFILSESLFAQQVPLSTALSFAPPPSDSSVIFLGNIFGVVDGVLSGTGSQLFGKMMQVFNSAVLALGSIVIMYTMIVGTLNTAQEGQFLGQKWSSIWIPVRCSVGLGLLVPKASGYCLMQVFFMWIIVQGVGAADKVWYAALQYLNGGGKIVQQQMSSSQILNTTSTSSNPIFVGAESILAGQVCMYGMQKIIENVRSDALKKASGDNPTGPCNNPTSGSSWDKFCNQAVPDFLSTFNAILAQQNKQTCDSTSANICIPMPNFTSDADSLYAPLNKACGIIQFKPLNQDTSDLNFSQAEQATYNLSRAIAVQQIYSNLTIVAQSMVNNDPDLNQSVTRDATPASYAANMQFGIAYNPTSNVACSSVNPGCTTWQSVSGSSTGVLFAGNELINAIAAYDGLMMPVLNLQLQQKNQAAMNTSRDFLQQAESTGWMYAGAYFFNLVNLSGSPTANTALQDTDSSLEASTNYHDAKILSNTPCKLSPGSSYPDGSLCWFVGEGGSNTSIPYDQNLLNLLEGNSDNSNYCTTSLTFNAYNPSSGYIGPDGGFQDVKCSSTTLGFIGNSYLLITPGQPGTSTVQMPNFPLTLQMPAYKFPTSFFQKCHAPWLFCIDAIIIDGLIAVFFGILYVFINLAMLIIGIAFTLLLVLPLKVTIWPMVQSAMHIITDMSINPIVSLANMGAMFIQKTFYTYLGLIGVAALAAAPFIGAIINLMLVFLMPLYTAWLTYFFSIGFTTAYYVPFLPYMIFTFGVISWLFNVIEAMVAAPIMALGVTTPEGEGILGKGEHGLMILMNVFLRPSMMVIGFVTATAMTYVSIWILNSGFGLGGSFLLGSAPDSPIALSESNAAAYHQPDMYGISWSEFPFAQMIGCMVYIVIYISMYATLAQKAFSLIYILPDRVMRWMGGHPEQSDVQQWTQETERKLGEFGKATSDAMLEKTPATIEKNAQQLANNNKQSGGDGGSISANVGGEVPPVSG